MIIVNFDNKPHTLKNHIIGVGVSIIQDDSISEADRTEYLGIGEADMQHYKEVMEFFAIKGIFIDDNDLNYKALLERYQNLTNLRELLKAESKLKFENANQGDRSQNIVFINKQIKSSIKMCEFYNSKISRADLNEAQLEAVEKEYNDIKGYPHRFKIMDTIDTLYNQLITEKMQLYPFAYYAIKKDLGF